jgi:hypothetical protein
MALSAALVLTTLADREEIRSRLQPVPGITAYTSPPGAAGVVPGAAWPKWGGLTPDRLWTVRWRIRIVLGSDPDAADLLLDQLVPPAVQALSRFAVVEGVEPVLLETSAGDRLAVEITTWKEAV